MKKTEGIFTILIILIILLISLASVRAELTEREKVQNVYSWLTEKTKNKWSSLNTKENVFALLALQQNYTLKQQGNTSLIRRSFVNATMQCWGKINATSEKDCSVVETAMAKIVLDTFGMNTSKVERWLLSKKKVQKGIYWYLQLDTDRGCELLCEIYYLGNSEKIFVVRSDKTVMLNGSSRCFTTESGFPYWFRLKDTEECLTSEYAIKCWSENATQVRATFLYKKAQGDNRWYVSGQTATGTPSKPDEQPQDLEPRLKIPSYCLGEETCNYEGTLWAAYAFFLQGESEKANLFVPYLVVNKEEGNNKGYFPSAFLSAIVDGAFTEEAKRMQQTAGYWKIQKADGGTIYGTLYNTALAKLMSVPADFEKAKEWILHTYKSEGTKGYFSDPSGGFETTTKIMENAFVLWQFWTLAPAQGRCEDRGPEFRCKESCGANEIDEGTSGCPEGTTCCRVIGGMEDCIIRGGSCREQCYSDETEWIWGCPAGMKCCIEFSQLDCEDDLNGTECEENKICSGQEVETLDKYRCCLGICIERNLRDRYCYEVGEKCESDEACINPYTRNLIDFSVTKDTNTCCVGGECVTNKRCKEIGEPCEGYVCEGNVKKTLDTDECCVGTCIKKTCEEMGGEICSEDKICEGRIEKAQDTTRCCIGKCKKKGGFPILLLIIIIAVGVGALYFFFIRKKPKEEKEEAPFEFPRVPPKIPSRPLMIQKQFPPLPKIPEPSKPEIKSKQEIKLKEETKREKREKKEKSELEKTLERLRKMVK